MNGYDGPMLRSLRESKRISLRHVARLAGLTHGHLSKLERGEVGRSVTYAVLQAYEKATGENLAYVAGHASRDGWQPGQLSDARRRSLNAQVAAVAVGGPLPDRIDVVLDNTGRLIVPGVVDESDVAQVEQLARLCTAMDLHYGDAVSDQMTRALLRWAIRLLTAEMNAATRRALYAAIAALAQRAGWSAFDAHAHEVSRSLFTIGLYAAGQADTPDLRAHILADVAVGHNYLGHPDACLQLVRLAEVDERVSPHVHLVIAGVKARAYSLLGDPDRCQASIRLAEQAHIEAQADHRHSWLDTIATAGRLYAVTGHALATLARRASSDEAHDQARDEARDHAMQRLTWAAEQLDPNIQRRSAALAMTQLATLHAETGNTEQARHWAACVDQLAAGIRSVRLATHLAAMRIALPDTNQQTTNQQAAHAGEVSQ